MADYLTDEEQAERLKAWWDKNGTSLVVALVVAVVAVVGWRYYQSYTADRANAASEAFRSYLDARAAAEPLDPHLAMIDTEHEGSTYHVFTLLYRAADEVQDQDWEEALALLERAVSLADERNLRDTARFRAAKLLYQLDRLDACAEQLAAIKSAGLAAPVAELAGDVAFARGDFDAARDAYRTAVEAARREPGKVFPGAGLTELKLASLVNSDQVDEDPGSAAGPIADDTPTSAARAPPAEAVGAPEVDEDEP